MSIRKRKSKKAACGYTYQVYFNYLDVLSGKKKQFSKSGFIDYSSARQYEMKKKLELFCEQTNPILQNKTLNDVYDEWMIIEAMNQYQENTRIDYSNRYECHIRYSLGDQALTDLNFRKIQIYFNNKKDIGWTTNYKLREILNVLFRFSIKCGYINENPMTYVEILGKENSRSNRQMTCSEALFQTIVRELNKSVSKQKNAYIIALMIGKYTGLRISEVFALDASDFDFDMQTISVTKKMIYANKQCSEIKVDTQLKNKASKSILPFHHDLQQIMKQWFMIHPHQHVISNEKGQYLNPKQMEHTLWRISARIGTPFHFHMLRHTFASRLIQQGADMKVAQELMRHASITTTMNIYTHISEESKKKALYQAFPIDEKS